MRKIIFILGALIIVNKTFSQGTPTPPQFTKINANYHWNQGIFNNLHFPRFGSSPTFFGGNTWSGAPGFDTTALKFRIWDGGKWRTYADSIYVPVGDSALHVRYGTTDIIVGIFHTGGGGGGGGSDGNNYTTAISFSGNVLTLSRLGLADLTAGFDTTIYHSYNFYNTKYAPAGSSGLPAGSNTQVQFNNSGAFGAFQGFRYTTTDSTLRVNAPMVLKGFRLNPGFGSSLFIGDSSGLSATPGAGTSNAVQNTAIGWRSMQGLTVGTNNVAVGSLALNAIAGGGENVAVGHQSALNTVGAGGAAGCCNTAVGAEALRANVNGTDNTAIGQGAMVNVVGANSSIAVGSNALQNMVGTDNVAIGKAALSNGASGNYNTVIGRSAGRDMTGDKNILIGYFAGYTGAFNNRLYIDNDGSDGVGPLIYGEFDNQLLKITGKAYVSTLATTGTAPATSGTPKMVVSDANGLLSFLDIPTGGGGGSMTTTDNALVIAGSVISLNKTYGALTDGSTITWNIATGYNKTVTIAGNRILTITSPQSGDYGTLVVTQDGTGGRTLTVPGGSVALNPAAGSITVIGFSYDGANYYWSSGYTGASSGAAAGNQGNVQIKVGSVLGTPGSDSLSYSSNALKVKGQIIQGSTINNVRIGLNEGGSVTSYTNPGGSGNRSSSITVSCFPGTGGLINVTAGSLQNFVDGAFTNLIYFVNTSLTGSSYVRFDFGSGASKIIDEAKYYQSDATSQGVWKWQGSNNGSTWTDIGGTFTLGGVTPPEVITTLSANTTGYRYYQILGMSGTTSTTPWINQMEFKIRDAGAGTYNFAQTYQSDTARGLLTLQPIAGYVAIGHLDSTSAPVNMLYQDVTGTIKKAAVPAGGGGGGIVGHIGADFTINTDSLFLKGAWVNVKDFGAVGDSVTDNLGAFTAALATGKNVFVPQGIFYLSNYATMSIPDQVIFGLGWKSVLRTSGNKQIIWPNADRVQIRGLHFLGDGKASGYLQQAGITLYQVVGYQIDNCSFEGFSGNAQTNGGGGLVGASTAATNNDGGTISNCYFYNNNCGMLIGARMEYVTVTGCRFGSNTVALGMDGGNETINNCVIQNNTTGIYIFNGTNFGHSSITGCVVNHNTKAFSFNDVNPSILGFAVTGCQIFYGSVEFNNSDNIRFANCHFEALDSVVINNSRYLSRVGCYWGVNSIGFPMFVHIFNNGQDFQTVGEMHDSTLSDAFIRQKYNDSVIYTGPMFHLGVTPASSSSSDSVWVKDASSGQFKLRAQSALGGGGGMSDPGANGVVVRTALNTTTARTITGTTNQIDVTNGTGVSGNPTLAFSSTVDLTGSNVSVQGFNGGTTKFTIKDRVDNTKTLTFDASTLATGTNVNLSSPITSGQIQAAGIGGGGSFATWAPAGDAPINYYDVSAQAVNVTAINAPTGTATNFNQLIIRVKDNGTARTIAGWNAIYNAGTNLAFPTTTTLGKTMYIKFYYNTNTTKWDLVSVIDGL